MTQSNYCNDKDCQNGACEYHRGLNASSATGRNGGTQPTRIMLHRVIAKTFIENPGNLLFVDHSKVERETIERCVGELKKLRSDHTNAFPHFHDHTRCTECLMNEALDIAITKIKELK